MLNDLVHSGRGFFWTLAGGLVLFVFGTLGRLPPVVASHFDGSGSPNGWSSRGAYAALLLLVGAVLPLAIVGLLKVVTRRGPDRLNIPAREYWTRPEHAAEAVRRVRSYLWWLGCIMAAIASAIHGTILAAHSHRPPHLSSRGIILVIGIAILALGIWIVGWYRLLQPPDKEAAR
ncbi:MAG: DUF1648 domain-containing protein [Gemmatimonadales bacterium]